MKKYPTCRAARYAPSQFKNFAGALGAFFAAECPHLGGERIRRVLVESLVEMVEQFYPRTERLREGQVRWITVHRDVVPSYGRRIADCRLISVTLDLVRPQDVIDLADGKALRELKKEAVARLFQQAYEQGGCMTLPEVSVLLKMDSPTVSEYARDWEAEHGTILPRQGTTHDMGPTLTHKREIIRKLFLEGKSVELVCQETGHSPEAVHRYIHAFKQVLLLRRKGLRDGEIAFGIRMSPRLVAEYQNLINQMSEDNSVLKNLLNVDGKEVK
jgi:transposase-like protein